MGGTIGTIVSSGFLLVLAGVNLVILRDVWRRYRHAQRGEPLTHEQAAAGAPTGLLSRALKPLFRLVTKSWHMYPVGVLFGLGFDTATEIGWSPSPPRKRAEACRFIRSSCFRPCSRLA